MSIAAQHQVCAWVEKPGPDAKIELRNIAVPSPGPGDVLVKLDVTGVCHSDHHSIYGNTPMSTHIAGHEGLDHRFPKRSSTPEWAYRGFMNLVEVAKYARWNMFIAPNRIIRAEMCLELFSVKYCVAKAAYIVAIPDEIPAEIAAPLLCGGITAYGALIRAKLNVGDYVVFTGAGGGLGHLGVQIARSLGYRVIAIDSGDKATVCMSLGAEHFFDFRKSASLVEDVRSVTGGLGAHAVVCITGAVSSYDESLPMLRNCGKLICVGIPPSSYRLQVNPFEMLVRGLAIIGSTVGDKSQMPGLMELVLQGKVKPELQLFDFDELQAVMDKLAAGQVIGRAVLRMP
uniref:Enoyl reductase (ER) domain-containing protein n=1 Tax=Bionectria ochroleuca TaxID=29856 RepID=A0A8H7N2K2_BIOOC